VTSSPGGPLGQSPPTSLEAARRATAKWRAKNVEHCRAKSLADYYDKREHYLALQKARREADPELYRQQNRESAARWREKNGQKNRDTVKAWRDKNPEKSRKLVRDWRKNNPSAANAASANKRARKRGADGQHTAADIASILKSQHGKCAYCRSPLRGKFHKDHIIALSRGGSNWPKNIQITCEPCNLRKHTKDPIQFAQEQGLLI